MKSAHKLNRFGVHSKVEYINGGPLELAEARVHNSRKQRRNLKQLYHDLVVPGYMEPYDREAAFDRDWRQRKPWLSPRGGPNTPCRCRYIEN